MALLEHTTSTGTTMVLIHFIIYMYTNHGTIRNFVDSSDATPASPSAAVTVTFKLLALAG